MGLIVAIIVGGLAGWIASMLVGRNDSMGVFGNVVIGFLGGVIANLLVGGVALSDPTWGGFFLTVLGATALLLVVNFFTRNRS